MHLLEDIRAYKKNDPAARSAIEVMLLYNGLHATIDYRIAHWFYRRRCFFIARTISQWSKMWTGIEIHPGATIGRRLVIDHGTGIVIGETAEIGDDCLLYQGVTLGGTGKDVGKRHPTLGNNVMVRFLADRTPFASAHRVEAGVEDAYMYLMRGERGEE